MGSEKLETFKRKLHENSLCSLYATQLGFPSLLLRPPLACCSASCRKKGRKIQSARESFEISKTNINCCLMVGYWYMYRAYSLLRLLDEQKTTSKIETFIFSVKFLWKLYDRSLLDCLNEETRNLIYTLFV